MFSDEGDLLVKGALAEFLPAANHSAAEAGLSTFHKRLSALQDFDVQSAGGSYVDDYLGWAEPEDYDASGAERPRHPTPNLALQRTRPPQRFLVNRGLF